MIVLMDPNQIPQQPRQVVMQQPNIPPNAIIPNGNVKLPKDHHTSFIVAVIMTVGFVLALVFGIWAFVGMVQNKTNLDEKIEKANAEAVEDAEAAKEIEFTEREKSPFKTYAGSPTFGSLTFDYPRSWSVYLQESTDGTILDFYGHPNFIPGLKGETKFAFRAQILSNTYDDEVKKFQKSAESGTVVVSSFVPNKLADQLGVRITGSIDKNTTGVIVLLPLRDKTYKFWTESTDYVADFDKVMDSLSFVP